MERSAFGDRLKALRKRAGFANQRSLAKAARLPQTTIADLERGATKNPRLDTLAQLADALRVPMQVLIEGMDHDSAPAERSDYPNEPDAVRIDPGNHSILDVVALTPADNRATLRVVTSRLDPLRIAEDDLLVIEIGGILMDDALVAYVRREEPEPFANFDIRRRIGVGSSRSPIFRPLSRKGLISSRAPFATIIHEAQGAHRPVGPVLLVLRRP